MSQFRRAGLRLDGRSGAGVKAVGLGGRPATGGYWISVQRRGQQLRRPLVRVTGRQDPGRPDGDRHRRHPVWWLPDPDLGRPACTVQRHLVWVVVRQAPAGVNAVGLAVDPSPADTGSQSNGGVNNFSAPWYGSLANGKIPAGQTVTGIAGTPGWRVPDPRLPTAGCIRSAHLVRLVGGNLPAGVSAIGLAVDPAPEATGSSSPTAASNGLQRPLVRVTERHHSRRPGRKRHRQRVATNRVWMAAFTLRKEWCTLRAEGPRRLSLLTLAAPGRRRHGRG